MKNSSAHSLLILASFTAGAMTPQWRWRTIDPGVSDTDVENLGFACHSRGKQAACEKLIRIANGDATVKVKNDDARATALHWAPSAAIDQAAMAALATNESRSIRLRQAAVDNLTDPVILAGIAAKDRDSELRQAAARRLGLVRVDAAKKLTDQATAAGMVANDKEVEDVRLAAVAALNDPAALNRLANSTSGRVQVLVRLKLLLVNPCVTDRYGAVATLDSYSGWSSSYYTKSFLALGMKPSKDNIDKTIASEAFRIYISGFKSATGSPLFQWRLFFSPPEAPPTVSNTPGDEKWGATVTLGHAWLQLKSQLDPAVVSCLLAREDLPFISNDARPGARK